MNILNGEWQSRNKEICVRRHTLTFQLSLRVINLSSTPVFFMNSIHFEHEKTRLSLAAAFQKIFDRFDRSFSSDDEIDIDKMKVVSTKKQVIRRAPCVPFGSIFRREGESETSMEEEDDLVDDFVLFKDKTGDQVERRFDLLLEDVLIRQEVHEFRAKDEFDLCLLKSIKRI